MLLLAVPQGAVCQEAGYDGTHNANLSDIRRCQDTLQAVNLGRATIFQQALLADTAPALVAQVDLVAQRIAMAARTALGAAGDAVPAADSLGIWMFAGVNLPFVVVVRRDQPGSWHIDTTSHSLSPKLSDFYEGVLRSIPLDSLWMVWPDGYAADSVAFRLWLAAGPSNGSIVATKHALFAVFSTKAIIEQPALVMEHQSGPHYPFDAEMHRVVGEVLLQFVVTADGRADMKTLKVLQPSEQRLRTSPFEHYYREFTNEAIGAVRHFRFYPARIGTCRVREQVRFPFSFETLPTGSN